MKLYEPLAVAGLFFILTQSYILKNKDENKNIISTPKNYTIVVDNGGFNLQENAGLSVIHNGDTSKFLTNYIGMANFMAYKGDTILVYPTDKCEQFNKLEKILTEETFNVINVNQK
jgi:hypothetical protein